MPLPDTGGGIGNGGTPPCKNVGGADNYVGFCGMLVRQDVNNKRVSCWHDIGIIF